MRPEEPESSNSGVLAADRLELADYRETLRKAAEEAISDRRWNKWRLGLDVSAVVAFVVVMTLLLAPPGQSRLDVPELDSIAQSTLRAEQDLLVQDTQATALRKQAALGAVPVVYDYDSELYFSLGDQVFNATEAMRERRDAGELAAAERRARFEEELGAPVGAGIFKLIEQLPEPSDLAIALNFFLNMGLDRMVVAERAALPRDKALEIRDAAQGSRQIMPSTGGIIDLRQLRRLMTARAGDAPYGGARIVRSWILETAHDLTRANLAANDVVTNERQKLAVETVEPVFLRIAAGEVLVRRGDRVSAAARERIRLLNEQAENRTVWGETAAVGLLLGGIMVLAAVFFSRGRVPLDFGRKSAYLTLAISGLTAGVGVAMFYAGLGLAEGIGFDPRLAPYFLPLAVGTGLIALLVDARTSLLAGIALTLFLAYRVNGDLALVTYYVVGMLTAGVAARHCRRRVDLLRIGLAVAVAQAAVVPVIGLLHGQAPDMGLVPHLLAALSSGVLVGVIILGLLPVLELAFDEITDPRLVELASADHPLLKELALKAPGTYYHSTMVANLAEAGADAVGANGLMCRVMALYHDIGKISRPGYFVENQREGENIHERVPAHMSARAIFGHVLDGLQMAQKAKLGRAVLEGIAQHHGTSQLRTFYAKAVRDGYNGPEETFRYPGPRPTRRETGILLLADSIEAATRALKDPSPAAVRDRVREIIQHRAADGQLDDCHLTMKDVAQLEETFIRTLSLGAFHNRIDYPPMHGAGGTSEANAGRHQRIHSLPGVANRPS